MKNDQEDELDLQFAKKRKKRKFKMDNKNQRYFFIKFIISCIAMEIYFLSNFLVSNEISKKMNSLIMEFNSTIKSEPYYNYIFNILR